MHLEALNVLKLVNNVSVYPDKDFYILEGTDNNSECTLYDHSGPG